MKKRTQVSKIMTVNPFTVNLTNSVKEVAQVIAEKNIRHVPVVSGNNLIGMISKNDIERISFVSESQDSKVNTQIYDGLKIEQIMTKQLDTVEADDEIRDAAKMLSMGKYNALPVMEEGHLKGIVTSTDVINYLLEQY